MQKMKARLYPELASFLLILLFTYAGVSKILDYKRFSIQLAKSPYISKYAGLLSWGLPLFEFFIVVMLLVNATRLAGLYFSLFVLSAFTAYIIILLNYSYYIPCSCGGLL